MAGSYGSSQGGVVTPTYTTLQLQTSVQGLPIPILWGATRISANVIGCFDFYSQPAGKGKGGKSGGLDYYAAVELALCEAASYGFNIAIDAAWVDLSRTSFADLGYGLFDGNASQLAWPTAVAAGQDVTYRQTAYLANGNLALGPSATIPQHNFEVFSTFTGFHVDNATTHLPDANFGDIIPDLLTNPQYTLAMPADLLVGFGTGPSDLTTYQLAAFIFVSPFLKDAEQVTSILQRWATIGNFWCFWNGTHLKVVCLGDTQIEAQGVTYIPNTTPVYDLGVDDFVVADKNDNKSEPPVKVTRKDPADGYNQITLNTNCRTYAYQTTPFRWEDQTSIDHVGVQAPNVVSAPEVCSYTAAQNVVSLIGKRQLYVRNDYAFKLLPTFILLEPGDIVTLTEPYIGLDKFPVRIKTVDEDDKGNLSFVAEEFVQGVGTASIQEFEPWVNTPPWDTGVSPGSVNPPAFLQPDTSLTQGASQVWTALSGGPDWGGCGVFLSFDGSNYVQIGQTENNSIQGTLTAILPSHSGLDTTNTLAVDCTESVGVIPTGATDADAQAYRTLCLVDNELLAYGSVVPTGSYTANLTYLERGLYGTTPASHAIGAPFTRIDQTLVFAYNLPAAYLGQTLYFKFPSVNIFGNQPQTLAECTAYNYTPDNLPTPYNVTVSYSYNATADLSGATLSWGFDTNFTPTSYSFRWSKYPSGTMGQIYGTQTGVPGVDTTYTISAAALTATGDGDSYISMQAVAGSATSAWTSDLGLNTIPPPTITSAATKFNTDGTISGVLVTWNPPAGFAPTSYVVMEPTIGPWGVAPAGASSLFVPIAQILAVDPSFTGAGSYIAMQAMYGLAGSLATANYAVTGSVTYPPLLGALTATPLTGAIRLNWSFSGSPSPTFYRVYYWYNLGGGNVVAYVDIAAPASGYTIEGLTGGTSYTCSAVTYNAAGTNEAYAGTPAIPTLSAQASATPT